MTLAAMVAAHDDAALEALASKGLLRRAWRDLEAGQGTVTRRDAAEATVETEGQTVGIDAREAWDFRCTCPSTGVCRHVLLAILLLREAAPPDASVPETGAAEELAALDEALLVTFAGADWGPALKLAGQADTIGEDGSSAVVSFAGGAKVAFLAGGALDGAIYKGPRTRERIHVAAAALAVRGRAGVSPSEAATVAVAAGLDAAFCREVSDALDLAVRSTLTGSAVLAADRLFDLAIGARAEAAPRLASQLRALSAMAQGAAEGDAAFVGTAFLEAAARCRALSHALTLMPDDPALTGVLTRTYEAAPPLDLRVMGARTWRTGSGARGLTVHLHAPAEDRWYARVTARAAGIDLSFQPREAYGRSLWGAGSAATSTGLCLHLPEPCVAADGQIAETLPRMAERLDVPFGVEDLAACGIDDWRALRETVAARTGRGLRRRATPLPFVLLPRRVGEPVFDDFAQAYRLPLLDRAGRALNLDLEADRGETAAALAAAGDRLTGLLVEASPGRDGLSIRPVTAMMRGTGGVEAINLDFEKLDVPQARRLFPRRRPAVTPPAPRDPLVALCDDASDALVDLVGVPVEVDALTHRLQAAGFALLGSALDRAAGSRGTGDILAAAYLAAEIRAELSHSVHP